MIIIGLKKLKLFGVKHANSRKSLIAWEMIVDKALWKKRQDVLDDFRNAKIIENNRVRFEINHNDYRLIAEIDYVDTTCDIRFIGTHQEYDRIDAATI